jgi:MFS superfamily sulfate permease-like transporter
MNAVIDFFLQADLAIQIAIGAAVLAILYGVYKVLKKLFPVVLVLAVLFVGYSFYTHKSAAQSAEDLLNKGKEVVETVKEQIPE